MIEPARLTTAAGDAARPSRALPRWLTAPLIAFVLTRLLVFAAVPLADAVLPNFNDAQAFTSGNALADFAGAWNRWDSVWYLQIATQGYTFASDNPRSTVAFFPLYPLAMAALGAVAGSPLVAGLLISHVALFVALVLLYRLTALKLGDEAAARTVFYVAAFPLAFFFSAIYTESLFLLLTVAAFYAAERDQWGWAGLCGLLAATARPTGALLAPALGLLWLSKRGWSLRSALRDWPTLLWLALIPVGVLAYMVYLNATFGAPLAFMAAQSGWRKAPGLMALMGDLQLMAAGKLWPSYIVDTFFLFAGLLMSIPVARRLGLSYAVYVAVSLLIPASSGVMSATRFVLVLFPLFMLLGAWGRRRWLDVPLRVLSLTLLPIGTMLFLKWVFLG